MTGKYWMQVNGVEYATSDNLQQVIKIYAMYIAQNPKHAGNVSIWQKGRKAVDDKLIKSHNGAFIQD